MKFTKTEKEEVKRTRTKIVNLQKSANDEFDKLKKRLNIQDDEALWDYCFNSFSSLKSVERSTKRMS